MNNFIREEEKLALSQCKPETAKNWQKDVRKASVGNEMHVVAMFGDTSQEDMTPNESSIKIEA